MVIARSNEPMSECRQHGQLSLLTNFDIAAAGQHLSKAAYR